MHSLLLTKGNLQTRIKPLSNDSVRHIRRQNTHTVGGAGLEPAARKHVVPTYLPLDHLSLCGSGCHMLGTTNICYNLRMGWPCRYTQRCLPWQSEGFLCYLFFFPFSHSLFWRSWLLIWFLSFFFFIPSILRLGSPRVVGGAHYNTHWIFFLLQDRPLVAKNEFCRQPIFVRWTNRSNWGNTCFLTS
jgi:hypothetical protein